jgi:hypothetical protein
MEPLAMRLREFDLEPPGDAARSGPSRLRGRDESVGQDEPVDHGLPKFTE